MSVYLMTGTLTGLLGNRILLMSRSKTLIPCSPLTFLSLFIAQHLHLNVAASMRSLTSWIWQPAHARRNLIVAAFSAQIEGSYRFATEARSDHAEIEFSAK